MTKAYSAQLGHIKRKLCNKEQLTGDLLKIALEIVGFPAHEKETEGLTAFAHTMGKKMNEGTPLDDYELHMMVDVFLVHERLGS